MASGPGNRAFLWLWGLQVGDTNPIPLDSNNHLRLEIIADFRKLNYYGLQDCLLDDKAGHQGEKAHHASLRPVPVATKSLGKEGPTLHMAQGRLDGEPARGPMGGAMWLCHHLPTWQVTLSHHQSVKYKCPLGVGSQHSRVLLREFHRQDFSSKREGTEIRFLPTYFAKEEHLKRKRSKKKMISCLHPLIKTF